MTITSRALVAVLAVGAFSGCSGDDTTSTPADDDASTTSGGSTSSDPSGSPTTSDPSTSGGTDSGPTSSTGEGTTAADSGSGDSGDTDPGSTGGTDGGSTTSGDGSSSGSESTSGAAAACGDGNVDDGEECDEGLANSDDASCTASCTLNVCGDGLTHLGVEACDDANDDNTDDCVSCQAASCGDGFTQLGVEACDDGDLDDLDACHNDCSAHVVQELALGSDFTCARFDSGSVKCWGHGASGRLGYGNLDSIGDDETPDSIGFVDLGDRAHAESIIAGSAHACAALDDGTLRCWGAAGFGQLGYGNMLPIGDNEAVSSVEPVAFGEMVTAVGSGDGGTHSCAVLGNGDVKCWGHATDAKLGVVGQTTNVGDNEPLSAAAVTDVGADVTALVTGLGHTCARTSLGNVRCWGTNAYAGLGYGNPDTIGDDEAPSVAGDVPLSDFITDLAAGWQHNCVVLESGDVQCWGRGNDGRLGYGNTAFVGYAQSPDVVGTVSTSGTVRQVAGGLAHTCALLDDGTVQCWGAGSFGQLGYGNTDSIGDDELPSDAGVLPLDTSIAAIATGGNHTCAITDTGGVRCWGQGAEGRLGYGNTDDLGDDETLDTLADVPLLPE